MTEHDSTATERATHTPGPWEMRFAENGGYDCMTDAYVVRGPGGPLVAVIDLDFYGQKRCTAVDVTVRTQAEANARLIAAAPDLLAALKAMVASYDDLRDSLTSPVVKAKLARADAAIAKAEGR